MKICLVNAPYLPNFSRPQRSPGVIRSGTLYFPYWLAFATGVLQEAGHDVLLLDAVAEEMTTEQAVARVLDFSPDMIVVEGSTPSIASDLAFCDRLKEGRSGAAVVMTGTHVSATWEEILTANAQVDYVALGEYEYTLRELAQVLETGGDSSIVDGLALRRGGKPVSTTPRPHMEDLDELPFVSKVYKQFLPIEKYFFSLARHPMLMLITGRGCPNNCFFCVYPQTMHGRRYRHRSPENVVAELEWIRGNMPEVKDIVFEDDTFTASPSRIREICRLMIDKKLNLSWFCNIRVNTSYETLEIMRKAGLKRCAVGFESGSQATLKKMGKGATLEQAMKFKGHCDRLGILVHGCFMFGFPGETRESLEETFQFAQKLNCDSAQFYPIFPYPGTEAHQWLAGEGLLRETEYANWLDSGGGHNCVYDLPGLSREQLNAFADEAYQRYYKSPRYLLRKLWQCVVRPEEAKRNIVSGMNFFFGSK